MESVEYWKNLAEKYKQNLQASQEELEEFQSQSRDYEKELEAQLDAAEKKSNNLLSANERLTSERDTLRDKLDSTQTEARRQLSRLEDELQVTRGQRDELQKYIRELEQTNDDLERAKRNVSALLDDLERRLNETIERNALLESELDDKDSLQMGIQRLKEETRDLKQELKVRETKQSRPASLSFTNGSIPVTPVNIPESMEVETQDNTNQPQIHSRGIPRSMTVDGTPIKNSQQPQSPFTPSARISALNIVGDLLRKVGALETKLASCRKYAAHDRNGGPEPKQPHLDDNALNSRNSTAKNHLSKTRMHH